MRFVAVCIACNKQLYISSEPCKSDLSMRVSAGCPLTLLKQPLPQTLEQILELAAQ